MTTQMHNRTHSIFVLLVGGEVVYTTSDSSDVFREARGSVYQYISDHKRHDLPLKMTDEELRWMDVEVHELLGERSQVALPYQEWIDDYYRELKEGEREDEEREYKRFVELRGKWEERFQAERAFK